MKVLFLPNWSNGNPYLNLLKENLLTYKFEAIFDNYQKWLPITLACLKNRNCHVVHLHWLQPIINCLYISRIKTIQYLILLVLIIDLAICKLFGKKIFWTVHNLYSPVSQEKKFEIYFRKILYTFSSEVFVHSKSSIEEIKVAYNLKNTDKITVSYHGHYIDSYPNTISREVARKSLNIGNSNKIILFIGNIREYKGVPHLIQEFNKIPLNIDASLIIAGRPISKEYEKKITYITNKHSNIYTFFEFIPDNKIQIYMNAADVCVFPYQETLTSGSIILAMSFGKPIIAPRKKIINEILEDEGVIYYDKHTSLYDALIKTLNCPNLSKMGENNKMRVSKFDWDTMCQNLANSYSKSLK